VKFADVKVLIFVIPEQIDQINQRGIIVKLYTVVKYISFNKRKHPNDRQVAYCRGMPEVPMHKLGN